MLGKSKQILLTLLTLISTVSFAAVNTQYNATVCGSGTYLFGCQQLTASGTDYTNTLGDSTVHLNLLFAPQKATSYNATIAPGQTYLFGCQLLTADATETNALQVPGCECDSLVTLHLSVVAPPVSVTVAYAATIEEGETYLFGCKQLKEKGTYLDTLARVAGGDSIIQLTLNVNAAPAPAAIQVACSTTIEEGETYLFGCKQLKEKGTYADTLARVAGGDSIIQLTLNVNAAPAPAAIQVAYSTTIEEGETYLFGCKQLKEKGTYADTLARVAGGDSIIQLTLNVNAAPAPVAIQVAYSTTIEEGETYLFGCAQLTAQGEYKDTLARAAGGDSIVVLTLTVNAAPVVPTNVEVAYAATIEEGETYLFGCAQLTAQGEYKDTLARAAGGDSIVVLTLTVNAAPVPPTEVKVQYDAEMELEDTYLFGCKTYHFDETGIQTLRDTLHLANNVDSIIIVNLTVKAGGGGEPTSVEVAYAATIEEGETYLFGCAQLTAKGTYKDTLSRAAGGDSIVVLTLTVNAAPLPQTVQVAYSADIIEGETYLFGCQQLTKAGIYKDTLVSAAGADSITILTLNVGCPAATVATPETATICKGESYTWSGHEKLGALKTSGVYRDTAYYANGCDSILYQLTLTVQEAVNAPIENVAICAGDSYTWPGHESLGTLTNAGIYLDTAYYQTGCDSVWYVLNLTIQSPKAADPETASICAGDAYTWPGHESLGALTAAGTYYDTAHYKSGCDSVWYQLTLSVRQPSTGDTTAIECDKFIWYEHTITTSGDYTHTFVKANAVGCDSVVTLHATINYSTSSTMEPVKECNKFYWASADTLITTSGTYTHVFQTVNGCDSVVSLTATISIPYETTLSLSAKFGNRLLMINRYEVNSLWDNFKLDSLDIEHPEYVEWYQIDLAGDTTLVGLGYTYSLESGDPLPTGYSYYASVQIPASTGNCGAEGSTVVYTIPAPAGAPALMPSLARPGEDIKVINLDPDAQTTIRVYTAEGVLQRVYTVSGQDIYAIKAAYGQGFYLVEVIADDTKSTLRYIVQ